MRAIVDGPYLTYRSFCAGGLDAMRKSTVNVVLDILESCDRVAIVWERPDGGGAELRRVEYPDYKANRRPKPVEYLEALDAIQRAACDMGVDQAWPERGEADDAAFVLAERYSTAGERVLLWTRDKDWLQMLTLPGVHVALPPNTGMGSPTIIRAPDCREHIGVCPERVIDLLALAGDASDGIPGMPRIGQKRAVSLIEACPDLVPMILAGQGEKAVAAVLGVDVDLAGYAEICARNAEQLRVMRGLVTLRGVGLDERPGVFGLEPARKSLGAIGCEWALGRLNSADRDNWGDAGEDDWGE